MDVRYEWNPAKSRANKSKHGLDFSEAVEVFASESECLDIFDEAHSVYEERFITIGPIRRGLVLVVWTERELHVVRVISARWATPRERGLYHRHLEQLP